MKTGNKQTARQRKEPTMQRVRGFETKKEAEAFVAGVEFVNDSSIEVQGDPVEDKDGEWIVTMIDSDYHEEDEGEEG